MDILVHRDGLPGGLVLVSVNVSQVGGVMSLPTKYLYSPHRFEFQLLIVTFEAS